MRRSPPTLAESQLFGHEKGAFTGALGASLGVFRAAQGGIVFLDEVGEMPLELQPKLLRVLQESEVTPVGAATPVPVDVQIIAATNRDLEAEVVAVISARTSIFRLNMVELKVPALRDRVEDIPRFIQFFSRRYAERYQRAVWEPDGEALQQFCEYSLAGQHSPTVARDRAIVRAGLCPRIAQPGSRHCRQDRLPFFDLCRLRKAAVRQALRATDGHKGRAAKLLGVHANTLTRMLAELQSEDQEALVRQD